MTRISDGSSVIVSHLQGDEPGVVLGSSADPDGSMRRYTIAFADGTNCSFADWQVTAVTPTSDTEVQRLVALQADGVLSIVGMVPLDRNGDVVPVGQPASYWWGEQCKHLHYTAHAAATCAR